MKKIYSIAAIVALFFVLVAFIPLNNANAAADTVNNGYCITATGTEKNGGSAIVYANALGEAEMSFDMLKNVEYGYFGVVFTFKTGIENFIKRDNYTMFSADGTQVKSDSLTEIENFSFEAGYSYKIVFSKSEKSLSIAMREIGDTAEYKTKYTSSIKTGATGVCGLAVMTTDTHSATVVIDNLRIAENGTEIFASDFNGSEPELAFAASHEGGYAEIYNRPRYRVAFVSENGELLQEQYVCQYNYAVCKNIPEKEGKVFSHWSESVAYVQKDLVVYPVYTDATTPIDPIDPVDPVDPSEPSEPTDPVEPTEPSDEKGGCGGTIGVCGGALSLLVLSVGYIVFRKEEKRK